MQSISPGDLVLVPDVSDHDGSPIIGRIAEVNGTKAIIAYDAPYGNCGHQPSLQKNKIDKLILHESDA